MEESMTGWLSNLIIISVNSSTSYIVMDRTSADIAVTLVQPFRQNPRI